MCKAKAHIFLQPLTAKYVLVWLKHEKTTHFAIIHPLLTKGNNTQEISFPLRLTSGKRLRFILLLKNKMNLKSCHILFENGLNN